MGLLRTTLKVPHAKAAAKITILCNDTTYAKPLERFWAIIQAQFNIISSTLFKFLGTTSPPFFSPFLLHIS